MDDNPMEPIINSSEITSIKQRALYSLILATFTEHWIAGYITYGIPFFVLKWYPENAMLDSTLWLYGAWAISYVSKPLGILFLQTLLHKASAKACLILCQLGWIASALVIMLIPLLKPSITLLSLILFIARFFGNFFVGGESILARSLFFQLPIPHERRSYISNYDRAKVIGYLLSIVTVEYLNWFTIFMMALSLSLLALKWRIQGIYPYQKQTFHSLKYMMKSITPYMTSGICLSYLSYSIAITYGHQMSVLSDNSINNNLMTFALLMLDVLCLTLLKYPKNLPSRIYLPLSSFMIGIGTYAMIVLRPPASLLHLTLIRLWIIPWGVLFSLVFYSSIADASDQKRSTQYLTLGMQFWFASMIYDKIAPWILLQKNNTSSLSYNIIVACILLAPIIIVLHHFIQPTDD